jgi:hypothetical protein
MNTEDVKRTVEISPEDLARLGGGALAYIREIAEDEAARLLGNTSQVKPGAKLYCLYSADGSAISISGTREAAMGSAFEHELFPVTVH